MLNFFEDIYSFDDVFWESKQPYPLIQWSKASGKRQRSCCHIAPTVPKDAAEPQDEPVNIGRYGSREVHKKLFG